MLDFDVVGEFLTPQLRDFGGKVEIAADAWGLFGVEVADKQGNQLAATLLSGADFSFQSGTSDDDRWTLYYVSEAERATAVAWLENWMRRLSGEIRAATPAQITVLAELPSSPAPHRIAQALADAHTRNQASAGIVREPKLVRALLDRLHEREPLYFSAFRLLITNHLIDMVELFRQLIPEDVALVCELLKGGMSRDPFLSSRQTAAAEIHHMFVIFFLINPLDHQKSTALTNPYAAFMELVSTSGGIAVPIDGTSVIVQTADLVAGIRGVRRTVYAGSQIATLQTHAPWVTPRIAHPLRLIKSRLAAHRDLPDLDVLYMLERAVAE